MSEERNAESNTITTSALDAWLDACKVRGWGATLNSALDVVEPFGPLLAQALWVLQPAAHVFGGRSIMQDLAQTLEDPEGIEALRQRLTD